MKVLLISLGCDKNRVDSEYMLGRLSEAGHLIVDGESFGADEICWRVNGEDFTYAEMRADCRRHWHPTEPATLIVKKPGGLKQGFHDLTYGFCCTHSYMPPFMEALEDPDKPAVIYFREFGQNTNSRRLLIVGY